MENEKYYSIIGFNKIKPENLDAHFKECETLHEALGHKDCSFIIVQRKLPGESIPGTGLIYPKVYSYKILDKREEPYFIEYKRMKCTDFIIRTKRMAYYDATADCTVVFLDRNGETGLGKLAGVYDSGLSLFMSLISFMMELEENCSADWKLYQIRKELNTTIEKLEDELKKVNAENENLKDKLKELRKILRNKRYPS